MENVKAYLLDADQMQRTLTRLAHEIIERNQSLDKLAVVGIKTRGASLAIRLAKRLSELAFSQPELGVIDISFYRDDLGKLADQPILNKGQLNFSVDGKTIILVDDVLYTGRTVRAAIDAIIDQGRPDKIQLAVLVDRGHRELPIRADFVGKNVPTSKQEHIRVELCEDDGQDRVLLCQLD